MKCSRCGVGAILFHNSRESDGEIPSIRRNNNTFDSVRKVRFKGLKKTEFPQEALAPVSAQATIFLGIVSSKSRLKGSSIAGKFESIGTGKTFLAEVVRTWTKVKVVVPAPAPGGGVAPRAPDK